MDGRTLFRRLSVAAALVAALALALFVVAAAAGLLALAAGYLWLTRRAADRDAATR